MIILFVARNVYKSHKFSGVIVINKSGFEHESFANLDHLQNSQKFITQNYLVLL